MPADAYPPAPPPSPCRQRIKQGGLVSGTGRLKHVKRRQLQLQHQQPPQPIPQQQEPPQPVLLTPREQFAQYYGFTLPPPPPLPEDPDAGYPYEYGGGIIKSQFPASIANSPSSSSTSSASSTSNSSSSSSSSSSDRWNNATAYTPPVQPTTTFRVPPPPAQFRRSSSVRASSSAPTCLPPLEHDDLMAKFNDQFVHSRTQSASDPLASPTKRERSIVPAGAEGKLLVPDVKLKVRCGSSASLESAASRRTPSIQSPLSASSSINASGKRDVVTSFTLKRPSYETRAWSYDNVATYPIMQLPPKKEKRLVKKIVDGEEIDVEIEVDVFETPKKLFLFAPKVVLR